MTRRVLVAGAKNWTDTATIHVVLNTVWGDWTAVLITGCCPSGADNLAEPDLDPRVRGSPPPGDQGDKSPVTGNYGGRPVQSQGGERREVGRHGRSR